MLADVLDLKRALDVGAIEPCFQPVVELRTGKLAGVEVLTRWRHEEHGLILPENFIMLAETHGLLSRLMGRILREAFRAAVDLPGHLRLSVNISALQMQEKGLPREIESAAQEYNFPLDRLTIEITESAFVERQAQAKAIAAELKQMGCRLALDDFGTGYSSLHLQVLPFDELKIDRSFVERITQTRENRKMVAAMIGLGHSLGMATVAEGVSTEEQAQMLLWLGCRLGQGYLFGKPVTADELLMIVTKEPQPLKPVLGGGLLSLEALPAQRLAQLQAIYDGSSAGMAFLDLNERYVNINRKLAALNNIPLEAHVGRTAKEMVPHLYDVLKPNLQRALAGEVIEEFEVKRPSPWKQGEMLTTLVSYHPARDEAGDLIGVAVTVLDITSRKKIEEKFRESEEHFRSLVELNPQTTWVCDADGNNLEVSPRWEHITGLTQDETRELGWMEAVHLEDRVVIGEKLMAALQEGSDIDLEYRVRTKSGDYRWMRSYGSPRVNSDGVIVRWYGNVWDVHDQKMAEAEVARLRDQIAELTKN